jgi:hypothetical protein
MIDSVTFFISAILLTQIKGGPQYSVKNYHVATSSDSQDKRFASTASTTSNDDDDVEAPTPASTTDIQPDKDCVLGRQQQGPCAVVVDTIKDFGIYLLTCGFGIFTLLKATAALIFGAEDIISTSFAEAGTTTEADQSFRMGLTFTLIGVGCLLGPAIANHHLLTKMVMILVTERLLT